jgi:hypothetical protein
MAEQAKWATSVGVSLVLETCGVEVKEKLFEMVEVDASIGRDSSPLRVTTIGKGDGLPMMSSNAWDKMFPPEALRGRSRSPMTIANSILYNNMVYGNSLGRLMGPVDNLFMYDYAVESRGTEINTWFEGIR